MIANFHKISDGLLSPGRKKLKPIISYKNLRIKKTIPKTTRNHSILKRSTLNPIVVFRQFIDIKGLLLKRKFSNIL